MRILTLDDFETKGKTVFLRVDMNCPIDPVTMKIIETSRIRESAESLKDLQGSKVVIASHQGRVGNKDYTGMENHAKVLEQILGRKIKYVEDIIGTEAQREIKNMKDGDILLLDNLRLCAEENYEFSPSDASKTIMVSRLSKLFDLCVLDSFPSSHRAHPSIVGFAHVLSSCAGRLVEREVRKLDEILTVTKGPHVVVLGGSKVVDRLEAIKELIISGRADQVLLTGVIANVFMRAQGRVKFPLGIKREEEIVAKAHSLIGEHPDVFSVPVDIAVDRNGKRVEIDVRELAKDDQILDLGPKTVEYYLKSIQSAGTVFMSGPAGFFENENFKFGTESLLVGVATAQQPVLADPVLQGLAHRVRHQDEAHMESVEGWVAAGLVEVLGLLEAESVPRGHGFILDLKQPEA